jgi:alkanesulfonate monooxygenase SsuD/methylene tetrahydromethanopterin reductase-like flavin-dependent oxidoreductase (luciferase family)
VAIVLDVAASVTRERNRARDRPVPADVLAAQFRRAGQALGELEGEGWDRIVVVRAGETPLAGPADRPAQEDVPVGGLDFVLQLSRFGWDDEDPAGWLRGMALAAAEAGFAGLALMDHLIQIPQVDRAWAPILEPWVTLGLLAGLDTRLRLGTLVSPVTFRPAGITAKTVATLDVLSGGRAFLGLGAGWWDREHAGYGLPFPPAGERLDALAAAIETIRALLSAGTKAHAGERVELPETTCYPRPVSDVPIIVGGSGARTLRIAAELADGCNVSSAGTTLERSIATLRAHCASSGRDPDEVAITVLDLPVAGADRDEVWARVEALRGRTAAATYARAHHAGTYAAQRDRYARLAEQGVRTVFLAPPHVRTPVDVLALAPMLAR